MWSVTHTLTNMSRKQNNMTHILIKPPNIHIKPYSCFKPLTYRIFGYQRFSCSNSVKSSKHNRLWGILCNRWLNWRKAVFISDWQVLHDAVGVTCCIRGIFNDSSRDELNNSLSHYNIYNYEQALMRVCASWIIESPHAQQHPWLQVSWTGFMTQTWSLLRTCGIYGVLLSWLVSDE